MRFCDDEEHPSRATLHPKTLDSNPIGVSAAAYRTFQRSFSHVRQSNSPKPNMKRKNRLKREVPRCLGTQALLGDTSLAWGHSPRFRLHPPHELQIANQTSEPNWDSPTYSCCSQEGSFLPLDWLAPRHCVSFMPTARGTPAHCIHHLIHPPPYPSTTVSASVATTRLASVATASTIGGNPVQPRLAIIPATVAHLPEPF